MDVTDFYREVKDWVLVFGPVVLAWWLQHRKSGPRRTITFVYSWITQLKKNLKIKRKR
ncbi:hypothetical protein GCM10011571_18550 [Marinithermofilum abyssi]|uniref:Uncharacterized protein n=1 Tax=Marinithermofilum abyssi TaxID=1571185 RepID=A0A8J2VDR5_9BACL|nr:hypothetical protein [Marinithermofilum abyssi]GGE17147.1 hypothetical protein GCM10011571_18550 [Marinithermofilum abyssi]